MSRIVFMGTPQFAATVLEALLSSDHEVVGVVTQPDRPVGRSSEPQPSAVSKLAEHHQLPLVKPERAVEALDWLHERQPDVSVVAAYGQILPSELLEAPTYGSVNVHGSLLPAYRGASPIQQALLDGLSETGVTIMQMDAGMDTGPILSQAKTAIEPTDTAGSLAERLAAQGAALLLETLPGYLDGSVKPQPQPKDRASTTRLLKKSDGNIDWQTPAIEIERLVRAMQPWPGAATQADNQRLAILEARLVPNENNLAPGQIAAEGPVVVGTGDGAIELVQVQPAGKSAMAATDWRRGYRAELQFTAPAVQ